MEKLGNKMKNRNNHKFNYEKNINYYKTTLKNKKLVSNIKSLPEFIGEYQKVKPNIVDLIYGGDYIPNIPHNCNGNSIYMSAYLLPKEFYYIEGVLKQNDLLFHHGWLYSRTLKCFVDPTLFPAKNDKYYISDAVSFEKTHKLTVKKIGGRFYDNPLWLHKNIDPEARIVNKNNIQD